MKFFPVSVGVALAMLAAGCGEKLDPVKADYDYTQDLPAGVTAGQVCYQNQVSQIVSNSCFPCHQAGGSASDKAVLDNFDGLKAKIDQVLEQVESGRMPRKGQPLTRQEIAVLGVWRDNGFKACTQDTDSALTLDPWVLQWLPDTLKVCYSRDVQPILENHCYECHSAGKPQLDTSHVQLDSLNLARLYIARVINVTSTRYMPRGNKPKLDSTELAILKYWQFTGLKECN